MKRLVALLTIVFTLGALWLTGAALADPAPAAEQVLRYATNPPETLDPAKLTGIDEQELVINLFEGLTRLDTENRPVPGVAKSWTISPDGLVYTFALRESKWSNGDPVTAQDFVYAWKRVLNPKTHSDFAFELYCLSNGEEYNKGEIFDDEQIGVKALDDLTLQVTLKEPAPYFLSLAAYPTLMPVHQKTVETRPLTWFLNPETMVSNGPFKMTKQSDKLMELSRNPLYWDAANTVLERLEIIPEDLNAQTVTRESKDFSAGKLDILNTLLLDELKKWGANPGFRKIYHFSNYYLHVNCQKGPLSDKRVRQALFLGINREDVVTQTKPTAFPAYAFVPGGTPDLNAGSDFRTVGGNYLTTGDRNQDLAKAKSLLAEAGYPNGKGLTVELMYVTNTLGEGMAKYLQSYWQKGLGIKVKLIPASYRNQQNAMVKGEYQLGPEGWIGDYAHPLTFLDLSRGGNANNYSGWQNKTYDDLLTKARTAQDPAASLAAMHEAEAILMDELPVIPILSNSRVAVFQPWVQGVHYNVLGHMDFKSARIEAH